MKYITAGNRILSLLVGVISGGGLTAFLWFYSVEKPWAWGMMIGSLVAIMIAVIFALRNHREHVKLLAACSRVGGNVFDFTVANVTTDQFSRRAYAFFSDTQIGLFLWDKRPYLESVIRRDEVVIRHAESRPNCMILSFDDDSDILLILPDAAKVVAQLQSKGYRVEEDLDHVR